MELVQTGDATSLMPLGSVLSRLAPLCESLRGLNARVGEEFLSLAAVLQSNSMRARQITSESHKATGSEVNLQSNGSIAVLQRLLADATGISDMVELSAEQMVEILSRLNAVRPPLQNLAKTRYLLQTVSLQAKIESARITSTLVDLSNFPNEINILANEIQQHVDRILDDSVGLSEVLQNGVRELRKYQQQESLPIAELIRRTNNVLGPVIARTEALQAAARDIDDQYASFHRSTDSVVMSLQAEDIARQRVEHVQEVIRRVAQSLDSGAEHGILRGRAGFAEVAAAQHTRSACRVDPYDSSGTRVARSAHSGAGLPDGYSGQADG